MTKSTDIQLPSLPELEKSVQLFKAFGDQTRYKILFLLAEKSLPVNEIAEITYEYSVKYDVILSPVFQNQKQFEHMADVLPYYQNIQKEGIVVG